MTEPAIESHCRIGKVRFKNGAEVTVLQRRSENDVVRNLMTETRRVIEDPRELTGFVLVGIYSAQETKSSFQTEDSFSMRLMPEFVAETLRSRMWLD